MYIQLILLGKHNNGIWRIYKNIIKKQITLANKWAYTFSYNVKNVGEGEVSFMSDKVSSLKSALTWTKPLCYLASSQLVL